MTLKSDFSFEKPLLMIGCGKMGGALLKAWLKEGLNPQAVLVVDPMFDGAAYGLPVTAHVADISQLPEGLTPKLLVLAIKPQMMTAVLPAIQAKGLAPVQVLSVAAGTSRRILQDYFPATTAVDRVMPNTPAAVGAGTSVGVARADMTADEKALIEGLMNAVGKSYWVEAEADLDAVTGLSGSGPAYVFHMVEAMAAAAVNMGLSEDQAMAMARQTVIGAGELLAASPETAQQLRRNVTSPNGTTEAGLNVLMSDEGLGRIMRQTIRAAAERSKELSRPVDD